MTADNPRTSEQVELHRGLARMLAGGVIMDVTSADQARLAEDAGAVAVMALERVPADIRAEGGVARMASIERIASVQAAVEIPVMAKCRIGHVAEARMLEELGVDFIDESEVLTPADDEAHVDKRDFRVPFVCGARGLGEALRRIEEGASLIRSKGEAGTGDVSEALRHLKQLERELAELLAAQAEDLDQLARRHGVARSLIEDCRRRGRLPVPLFAAGGIATPADATLVLERGAETIFVGSGVFKSADPARCARALVAAVGAQGDAAGLLEACRQAPEAMSGIAVGSLGDQVRLAARGN